MRSAEACAPPGGFGLGELGVEVLVVESGDDVALLDPRPLRHAQLGDARGDFGEMRPLSPPRRSRRPRGPSAPEPPSVIRAAVVFLDGRARNEVDIQAYDPTAMAKRPGPARPEGAGAAASGARAPDGCAARTGRYLARRIDRHRCAHRSTASPGGASPPGDPILPEGDLLASTWGRRCRIVPSGPLT